jgi:SAM-dependent methyltransferase
VRATSPDNPHRGWLEQWFAVPDPMGLGEARGGAERFRVALEALPARTGRTLELGCAEGHFTELVAPRASALLAVELIGAAAERARARLAALGHVQVLIADLIDWRGDGEFDTVLGMGVLYYVPAEVRRDVAAKIASWLPAGGRLLLQHEVEEATRHWGLPGAHELHGQFASLGLHVPPPTRTGVMDTVLARKVGLASPS